MRTPKSSQLVLGEIPLEVSSKSAWRPCRSQFQECLQSLHRTHYSPQSPPCLEPLMGKSLRQKRTATHGTASEYRNCRGERFPWKSSKPARVAGRMQVLSCLL